MGNFTEKRLDSFKENPFDIIGNRGFLVTAGDSPESCNTMTAGWGGLGVFWNRNACLIFVRKSRHTHQFLEKSQKFTLSFFHDEYRGVLDFCGANSGRDVDKIARTGLHVCPDSGGFIYFDEARLVLCCGKIFAQDTAADSFIDKSVIRSFYSSGDFHRIYAGEIVKCLVKA